MNITWETQQPKAQHTTNISILQQRLKYHFASQHDTSYVGFKYWLIGNNAKSNNTLIKKTFTREKCVIRPDAFQPSPIWHGHPWKQRKKSLKVPSQIISR